MITIELGCITQTPCNPGCIGSIAYDGCGFALLDPRFCGVLRLDKDFCLLGRVSTPRPYTKLCYDPLQRCYWAISPRDDGAVYQLDTHFEEIGRLAPRGAARQRPCGIGCDPCNGTLWLLFPSGLVQVDPCSGEWTPIEVPCHAQMNLELLSLCDGQLISYLAQQGQRVQMHCGQCASSQEISIPAPYYLEGMVLHTLCSDRTGGATHYEVVFLLSKRASNQLYRMPALITCEREPHPPCPPPHPPCPPEPYPPCPCPPPHPPCPPEPCPPCPCPPPHPPCPPTPPHPHNCCYGAYEIMHSVALEEAGIAHILNAEGEKLQKAVACATSIEELLCINESVRRTIIQITQLEGQLYSKLESVSNCCDDACDSWHAHKPPSPCCP